ncbi:hypothetical protein [Vibrio sp. ABG19]|uniref:hypothetical protein n=1 Tax=Vibrio sp. ABG19 TaxID=2817385 RepID=UPI00249EA999|nr:hypothetical protein [Vibrio sp. ABG19]WGY45654.1 hypothetical protein J0X00_02060 [Vibrio sp. ABG19]
MKLFKTAAVAGVIVSALTGCQSTGNTQSSAPDTTNPQQVATQTDAFTLFEQIKAEQSQWHETLADLESFKLYSPGKVRDLQDAWEETTEVYNDIVEDPSETTEDYSIFSSATYAEKYMELLGETKALYQQLTQLKAQADELLADSISQMDYLDQLDTKTAYASDYSQIHASYLKLFRYIDENELNDAQFAQVKFLDKAKQLEIKVVLKKYVTPLKAKLLEFRTTKLNFQAPLTYQQAEAEVAKVELAIKTDSRDFKAIEQAVKTAEFELNHTVNVANEVTKLSLVKNRNFEPVVLNYEKSLLEISQQIDGADYRDQSFGKQAKAILASLQANNSEVSGQNDELAQQLSSRTQELNVVQAKLQATQAELAASQTALQHEKELSERLSKLLESYSKTVQTVITANSAPPKPTATGEAGNTAPATLREAVSPTTGSIEPQSLNPAPTTTN